MKNLDLILYVDDEPINLALFEIMFRGVYEIKTVKSGDEALKFVKENGNLNAVITDMKMPVMNGLEFVELARGENDKIPYFLLSGYGLNEQIDEALTNNLLNGYFQKPLNKELIVSELNKHLKPTT